MKEILIVEDDRSVATGLEIRLKSYGYEVAIASDATTGVNSALKLRPDLVLLDISMPGGGGFSVAERLQRILPTMTPFIFLTASKQPDLREKAIELGAAGFFEKPYDAGELLAAIKRALSENEVTKQYKETWKLKSR
jgi:DNA-binding response OmpR family regulator